MVEIGLGDATEDSIALSMTEVKDGYKFLQSTLLLSIEKVSFRKTSQTHLAEFISKSL